MASSDGLRGSDAAGTCHKKFGGGLDAGEVEQGSQHRFWILTKLIVGQDPYSVRIPFRDFPDSAMDLAPITKRGLMMVDHLILPEKIGSPDLGLLLVSTKRHVDPMANHHDHSDVITNVQDGGGDYVEIGFLDEPTGVIPIRFHGTKK